VCTCLCLLIIFALFYGAIIMLQTCNFLLFDALMTRSLLFVSILKICQLLRCGIDSSFFHLRHLFFGFDLYTVRID